MVEHDILYAEFSIYHILFLVENVWNGRTEKWVYYADYEHKLVDCEAFIRKNWTFDNVWISFEFLVRKCWEYVKRQTECSWCLGHFEFLNNMVQGSFSDIYLSLRVTTNEWKNHTPKILWIRLVQSICNEIVLYRIVIKKFLGLSANRAFIGPTTTTTADNRNISKKNHLWTMQKFVVHIFYHTKCYSPCENLYISLSVCFFFLSLFFTRVWLWIWYFQLAQVKYILSKHVLWIHLSHFHFISVLMSSSPYPGIYFCASFADIDTQHINIQMHFIHFLNF